MPSYYCDDLNANRLNKLILTTTCFSPKNWLQNPFRGPDDRYKASEKSRAFINPTMVQWDRHWPADPAIRVRAPPLPKKMQIFFYK